MDGWAEKKTCDALLTRPEGKGLKKKTCRESIRERERERGIERQERKKKEKTATHTHTYTESTKKKKEKEIKAKAYGVDDAQAQRRFEQEINTQMENLLQAETSHQTRHRLPLHSMGICEVDVCMRE